MKQVSSILATALCLACFTRPALASDTARIEQGGGAGNVAIEQIATAGNNVASVRQGDTWYYGSGNNVQVMQQNVQGSYIEVYQSGYNNQHAVFQSNGGNLQANINTSSSYYGDYGGESNSVTIQQTGYDARAWVEQGASMYSRAEVVQQGWNGQSMAEIVQAGEGNQAGIFQSGANQAVIHQMGSNLSASIVQNTGGNPYGNGNSATIRQMF